MKVSIIAMSENRIDVQEDTLVLGQELMMLSSTRKFTIVYRYGIHFEMEIELHGQQNIKHELEKIFKEKIEFI